MAAHANLDNFQIPHCIVGLEKAYVSEQNNTLYGYLVCIAEKTNEISEKIFNNSYSDIKKSDWAARIFEEKGLQGFGMEKPKKEGDSFKTIMESVLKHNEDEHACSMSVEVIPIAFPEPISG